MILVFLYKDATLPTDFICHNKRLKITLKYVTLSLRYLLILDSFAFQVLLTVIKRQCVADLIGHHRAAQP